MNIDTFLIPCQADLDGAPAGHADPRSHAIETHPVTVLPLSLKGAPRLLSSE